MAYRPARGARRTARPVSSVNARARGSPAESRRETSAPTAGRRLPSSRARRRTTWGWALEASAARTEATGSRRARLIAQTYCPGTDHRDLRHRQRWLTGGLLTGRLQLDVERVTGSLPDVLGAVALGVPPGRIAGLEVEVLALPVRRGEPDFAGGKRDGDIPGVRVHGHLRPSGEVNVEYSHALVFGGYSVGRRRGLDWIHSTG